MRSMICWRLYCTSSARPPSTRKTKVAPGRPLPPSLAVLVGSLDAARPFQPFRRRVGGEVLARDRRPVRDQVAAEKPYFSKALGGEPRHEAADRLDAVERARTLAGKVDGLARAGHAGRSGAGASMVMVDCSLVWRSAGIRRQRRAYHGLDDSHRVASAPAARERPMTAVARKQLPFRPAGPIRSARCSHWYDRERRDLPWRAPRGRARRSLPRLALRDHAAADHGRRPSSPSTCASWRAGRRSRRWPRRRSTTCSPPGRGSATTAAPATCTRCARIVAERYAGRFPATDAELRKLPGIGPYTAAAIAAIAFGEPATPVDGNIERVVARLFAVQPAAAGRQGRNPAPGRAR